MISYGSQKINAETLCEKRSHQLGEGPRCGAAMPTWTYPPRPVYGSQQHHTEMSYEDCSHQLGEGQSVNAAMSPVFRPSQPVYGSLCYHAAMPIYDRSHLFTRGLHKNAAMLKGTRLSREGSEETHSNVAGIAPFPISLREPIELRRNANLNYLPPDLGHLNYAAMLISKRPILTRGQSNFAAMPFIQRLATKEIQYG